MICCHRFQLATKFTMCRDCDYHSMKMMLSGHITGCEVDEWYYKMYRCHLRYGNKNWITVYLSDCTPNPEKEECYGLSLDFYTYYDYLRFLEFRGELTEESLSFNLDNSRLSTFFYVSDYKADTKPHKGHYYMNLEVLASRWQRNVEDNSINNEAENENRPVYFFATFIENQEGQNSDTPLLVQEEPLVYPQWMFLDFTRPFKLTAPSAKTYSLRVNNVEQGNWNEILADNKKFLMFDIGTNAFGSMVPQDIQRQLRNHPVQEDVDSLFISHWHADHYNILTGMNYKEKNHIKQLVCPPSVYNLTAFNIMLWYAMNPNSKLIVQQHPAKGKWSKNTAINNMLNLYMRPFVKSNPNNGGLLLFFTGSTNCVTLTGDANYSVVQSVTNDGITQFNCQGGYYMVVPHHGGDAGTFTCSINPNVKRLEAIISVGNNNPYDHPDDDIVDNLKLCFPLVSMTCKDKLPDRPL